MPDPLAPQDIARASFGLARRGYEQQAVRGFLHEVSALVERLTRTEKELREQLQRAETRIGSVEQPDEATLLEILGAETTRVLTSAHEAASEIRIKAEAAAERIISEATVEATGVRDTADREVAELVAQMTSETELLRDAARNELELRKAEAHAAAERIKEEGRDAARALREDGQAELAKAQEEVSGIVDAAQQQGREMVAEAQAVRERVLRDLAVRRKRARQQVEKLNAGRERLLQAYATVRGTIDEATNELTVSLTDARLAANAAARRVEEEPEQTLEQLDAEVSDAGLAGLPIADYVNSDADDAHGEDDGDDEGTGPLSGEVPIVADSPDGAPKEGSHDDVGDHLRSSPAPVLTEARTVSGLDDRRVRKGRRKKGFEGLPPSELTVLEAPRPDEGVRVLPEPDPEMSVEPESALLAVPEDKVLPEAVAEPEPAPEEIEPVIAEAAPEVIGGHPLEAQPASDEAPEPTDPDVAHDVFARLREQADTPPIQEASAAEDAPAGAAAAGEQSEAAAIPAALDESAEVEQDDDQPSDHLDAAPFAHRAAAVDPIDKELRKRLKRALADEQNEVLDLLRRAKPKGVDDLLPAPDAHVARWADAASAPLDDAAAAGAEANGGSATPVTDLAIQLAEMLTAPLRDRIDRSFAASDGNLDDVTDRVRALYREWKGQRLAEASEHFTAAAYARGVFDGVAPNASVQWVVDPTLGACPDCDDNVLAGAIPKGEEFPTGSPCAPAHPGCHCLVLAIDA